jgi:hypothetical protein
LAMQDRVEKGLGKGHRLLPGDASTPRRQDLRRRVRGGWCPEAPATHHERRCDRIPRQPSREQPSDPRSRTPPHPRRFRCGHSARTRGLMDLRHVSTMGRIAPGFGAGSGVIAAAPGQERRAGRNPDDPPRGSQHLGTCSVEAKWECWGARQQGCKISSKRRWDTRTCCGKRIYRAPCPGALARSPAGATLSF